MAGCRELPLPPIAADCRRPAAFRCSFAGVDVLLNKESKRETPSVISFTSKMRQMGTDAGACTDAAAERPPESA